MDPEYLTKNIVDLTETELIALGFLGDDAPASVKSMVEEVRADPGHLGTVTCFMVDCLRDQCYRERAAAQDATHPSTSPTISEAETLFVELTNDPAAARTVVAPDLLPKYEANFWYHGLSGNPPKAPTNPFPVPPPGTPFARIPTKSARGVFRTRLNAVWEDVAPRILAAMKARGVKYSMLTTARFAVVEDGGDEDEDGTLGPVVAWIAVRPSTSDAAAVRDATPDILQILADVEITDVTVEWYSGSVARLVDLRSSQSG
ncbi:hypothetical protein FA13DRAFT_1741957 [Coprinellus micaceus]|uniref:Uncharacterized protein n=1 Tax=Coprinellus micaceus TaxID=71717 RepID=A0A4Y7SI11_COPMI|nr:hypothetical protein FA13DRAFT_1741957 [Coprinellus micaceus]